MASKYSRAELVTKANLVTNLSALVKALGLQTTGSYHQVKALLRRYKIDPKHWTSRARKAVFKDRLLCTDILVYDRLSGGRESPRLLRRAMLEAGVPHACAICGMGPTWKGKRLQLQIDHLSGNPVDNRRRNLRFLCPNCHSQTPTHSVRRGTKKR